MEEAFQLGPRGLFAVREAKRLANLRLDLRLAEDHGVEPAGDGEQMLDGVPLPVGVETVGQLLLRDAARLDQQAA